MFSSALTPFRGVMVIFHNYVLTSSYFFIYHKISIII